MVALTTRTLGALPTFIHHPARHLGHSIGSQCAAGMLIAALTGAVMGAVSVHFAMAFRWGLLNLVGLTLVLVETALHGCSNVIGHELRSSPPLTVNHTPGMHTMGMPLLRRNRVRNDVIDSSCLALLAGPLVLQFGGAKPRLVAALDGFVLVGVLGLVFLHVIPHAIVDAGAKALVAAAVGFCCPSALKSSPVSD